VRRRPTEVPTHYGVVLQTADASGVKTPLLEALLDGIRELERGGEMSEERLEQLPAVVA
jgi:ketopantoate reductase